MTMLTVASWIDRIAAGVGKIGSLVLPLLVLTICINVFLRYVFSIGMIQLEELQWHLNALVVMSCMAWAYQTDDHVRVDAFHARFSPRTKAWVELLGVLFLFLPFTYLVSKNAWTIFSYSWALKESSPMPSGLPARYVIKFVMAAGFTLLTLQGLAIGLKSLGKIMRGGQI